MKNDSKVANYFLYTCGCVAQYLRERTTQQQQNHKKRPKIKTNIFLLFHQHQAYHLQTYYS